MRGQRHLGLLASVRTKLTSVRLPTQVPFLPLRNFSVISQVLGESSAQVAQHPSLVSDECSIKEKINSEDAARVLGCTIVEIEKFINFGDLDMACLGLRYVLGSEESRLFKERIQNLFAVFLPANNCGRALVGLKLLLEQRVFYHEVCPFASLRSAILTRAVNQACAAGIFREWEGYGKPFRDLVELLMTETSESGRILTEMLSQAPVSRKEAMYNAILECFQSKQVLSPSIWVGEKLLSQMLQIGLVPTPEACEAIITCHASVAYQIRPRGAKACLAARRAYAQTKRHLPHLSRTCFWQMLAVLPLYDQGDPAAQTERFLVMLDMIEENHPLPHSTAHDAIVLCEGLLVHYQAPGFACVPQQIPFDADRLAHRIQAILMCRAYLPGISTAGLFAVLVACFERLAMGDSASKIKGIKTLIDLVLCAGETEPKPIYDAAMGPIGAICPASMRKMVVDMVAHKAIPDARTLAVLIHSHVTAKQPTEALLLFHSLTREMRTGGLENVPRITPDAKAFSLAILAASHTEDRSSMKELWKSYAAASLTGKVVSVCYQELLESFREAIIVFKSDSDAVSELFGIVQQILKRVDSKSCLGSRGGIYETALKTYANILSLAPQNALLNHTSLLGAYRRWVLDRRRSVCPTVYSHVFNALSECLVRQPALQEEILRAARSLSQHMLELRTVPVYSVFAAQIKLFGLGDDVPLLESAFKQFLAFCSKQHALDHRSTLLVFSTYARFCPLAKQQLDSLLDSHAHLGLTPEHATYSHLLFRLVELEAPTSLFWDLLYRLEDQFESSENKGADIYIPFKMIKAIAQHFYRSEGAWSMDQVVEFICELAASHTGKTQLQLNVFMLEKLLSSSPATREDPTPLVAKWFNRILSDDGDLSTRKRAMDLLWGISGDLTHSPCPWSVRSRFRKMLERTNNLKHPDPFVRDIH